MTSGVKKTWARVALRSIAAVVVGISVVSAFVVLLSLYGASTETKPVTAVQSIKFPENEKMLDDTAAQLAREGAKLSNIEPAAGDKNIKK